MASAVNTYNDQSFRVVHPLHDVPEKKCSSEGLGKIEMTRSVRVSLMILRGYLIGMMLMLGYHVVDLTGTLHKLR